MLEFISSSMQGARYIVNESSGDQELKRRSSEFASKFLSFEYEEDLTNFINEMVALAKGGKLKPVSIINSSIFQSSYESTVGAIQFDLQEIVKKSRANPRRSFSVAARKFVKFKNMKDNLLFSGKVDKLSPSDITILAVQIFWRGFSSLEKCMMFKQSIKSDSEQEDLKKQVAGIYRSIAKRELTSPQDYKDFFEEKSIIMFDVHYHNGNELLKVGSFEQARESFKKAFLALDGVFKVDSKEVGEVHDQLGWAFFALAERAEALIQFKAALPIYEGPALKDRGKLGDLYNSLGSMSYYQREYEEAAIHFSKALPIYHEVFPGDQKKLGLAYYGLAATHFKLQKYKEAGEGFEKVLLEYKKIIPKESGKLGELHNNLGCTFLKLEQYEKALWHFRTALAIAQNLPSKDMMPMATSYKNLGFTLKALKKYQEAGECFVEVLAVYRKHFSSNSEEVASIKEELLELSKLSHEK